MKNLVEYIKENLECETILEELLTKIKELNIKITFGGHTDERFHRNLTAVLRYKIIYAYCKVGEDILFDLENNVIKDGDNIGIVDKSEHPNFNIVCIVNKHNDCVELFTKTHMKKDNFVFKEVSKVYNTFTTNKRIEELYDIKTKI